MWNRAASAATLVGVALLCLNGCSSGTPGSTQAPRGYRFCAQEGETCVFDGVQSVAFGAAGHFHLKNGITGSITCDNATLGDPLEGVAKACYVTGDRHHALPPQPLATGYAFCAHENETCSFDGVQNVAFGADGRFYYKNGVTGSVRCDGATFGDPLAGVVKACYVTRLQSAVPAGPDR